MPPTWARKDVSTWHYYTSTPLIRQSEEKAGSINRLSSVRLDDEVLSGLEEANICPPGARPEELLKPVDRIILHPAEIEISLKEEIAGQPLLRIRTDLTSVKNATRLIRYGGSNQRDDYLIRSIALAFDGRQPADLSLSKLHKIQLDRDWRQQRWALGFLHEA